VIERGSPNAGDPEHFRRVRGRSAKPTRSL
jgi:hypothetical protein